MTSKLRTVFAGTPVFAATALQALLTSTHEVVAVYTQPDRPAGRGRRLTASPVKQLALDHGITLHQPQSLRDEAAQQILATLNADVMVVVAYGLILPPQILTLPRYGCINIHSSLLPRWRGAAPIQRAIEAGDTESGVTIIQMDEGLDTGAMLVRAPCAISATETAETLHDRLANLGATAVLEALSQMTQGRLQPTAQESADSCYAAKIHKHEADLDFSQPAAVLERKIRAFNPWPIARATLNEQLLRIWQASALDEHTDQPPGVIVRSDRDGIDVATGEGLLRLTQLQRPGGKAVAVSDLFNANAALYAVGQRFVAPPA